MKTKPCDRHWLICLNGKICVRKLVICIIIIEISAVWSALLFCGPLLKPISAVWSAKFILQRYFLIYFGTLGETSAQKKGDRKINFALQENRKINFVLQENGKINLALQENGKINLALQENRK